MKQNQFKFKPFDKVLVRDADDERWTATFYSFYDKDDIRYPHACIDSCYTHCIPYNEDTAHLLGTNKPYEKPEPKVWKVISATFDKTFTSEELLDFIKVAVIDNKDILDLRIVHVDE